ncbi:MAG: hypothetical protein ABJB10_00655 [Mesorhizobium sp.]
MINSRFSLPINVRNVAADSALAISLVETIDPPCFPAHPNAMGAIASGAKLNCGYALLNQRHIES